MGWWKVEGTEAVIGDFPLHALEGAVAEVVAAYQLRFNRRIDALPEAHHDDSHHRDYYVMLALGVLNYAIRVVVGSGHLDSDAEMEECDAVLDSLANDLDVTAQVDVLRARASDLAAGGASIDGRVEVASFATSSAPAINAALDAVATQMGWPLDRVRP